MMQLVVRATHTALSSVLLDYELIRTAKRGSGTLVDFPSESFRGAITSFTVANLTESGMDTRNRRMREVLPALRQKRKWLLSCHRLRLLCCRIIPPPQFIGKEAVKVGPRLGQSLVCGKVDGIRRSQEPGALVAFVGSSHDDKVLCNA